MGQSLGRKIAFFDIDKTVYDGFLIFPLVETQTRDGLIDSVASREIQAELQRYQLGETPYGEMVRRVLVKYAYGLQGKSVSDVLEHTKKYLTGEGAKFYPYVSQVIGLLKETHDVFFVTAEPQFVGQSVNEIFGTQGAISTVFTTKDEIFTGEMDNALSSSQHKADAIAKLLSERDPRNSFAFGDSEGDVGMLDSVEYAVCVNPSLGLEEVAKQKKWFTTSSPTTIPDYVASKL